MYNLGHYLLALILLGQVSFLNKGDKVFISSKDAFVQSGAIFVVTNFII